MSAIFSIIWSIIKAVLGMGANKPSVEAVATGNAAAASVDLAVAKTAGAKSAAIAQAEVDAPTTPAAVVSTLQKGAF